MKHKKPYLRKPNRNKFAKMEPKLIAEAETGKLGRISIYHTAELSYRDIAHQVIKCLNENGYGVYIKTDSFDLGVHVGNGTLSPSVNIVPLDRPGMGCGPHGFRYGTTVISPGFVEVSHPGVHQSLIDHFKSLETVASA